MPRTILKKAFMEIVIIEKEAFEAFMAEVSALAEKVAGSADKAVELMTGFAHGVRNGG